MVRVLLLAIFCLIFSGCAMINSLVEKGGRLLDGSMAAFKTKELWRTLDTGGLEVRSGMYKNGTNALVFSVRSIPYLTFYATEPDKEGIFFITKLHFLAGNYGGWQEYDMDAAGKGRFLRYTDNDSLKTAKFSVTGGIECHSVSSGKIRRDTTRLAGERALKELQSRNERVKYLTGWMRSSGVEEFDNETQFEAYWRPRLLPAKPVELVLAPELPELLQIARAEGALEADWDEAVSWIYMDYDWKKITSVLNNEVVLTRIR